MEPVPMACSGAVTHAPWWKGQPQAPYQADFSVRMGPSEAEKNDHMEHINQSSLFD